MPCIDDAGWKTSKAAQWPKVKCKHAIYCLVPERHRSCHLDAHTYTCSSLPQLEMHQANGESFLFVFILKRGCRSARKSLRCYFAGCRGTRGTRGFWPGRALNISLTAFCTFLQSLLLTTTCPPRAFVTHRLMAQGLATR